MKCQSIFPDFLTDVDQSLQLSLRQRCNGILPFQALRAWPAGCFQPICFRTVCSVHAQTCLSSNDQSGADQRMTDTGRPADSDI